jgi:CubicO group peptidase (beta-lactamase class C family)
MPYRFDTRRLTQAFKLLDEFVEQGSVQGIAAAVGSSSMVEEPRFAGRQRNHGDMPLADDAIFLIASPTKPIVALAVMMLVQQGRLRLADAVHRYVPEFSGQGKRGITIAHCLTHTSGLPDMLPDNAALRAGEAPLSEFLSRTCALKPEFTPGTRVQYQSTGYLMLGEVLRRVAGRPLGELLEEWIFEPLGMLDTVLGMPASWETPPGNEPHARVERIAEIRLPAAADPHSACWNTRYWRRLGAPWGGLLSTPSDLARFCQHLLQVHQGRDGIISPVTLEAMTRNQLELMPEVPEANRRCQPWGLGWQLNWPAHATAFCELLSFPAYGHWGATGTVVWIDPRRDLFTVALSTEPLTSSQRLLTRFSNAVAAASRAEK